MKGKRRKIRILSLVIIFALLALMTVGCASGAPPNEAWNKTFGGTNLDSAYSVQQTTDGGYILAGSTSSYGAGRKDFWLVKTDSNGNEQWNKTFGGTNLDSAHSVRQTSDGGYILAGFTNSYDVGTWWYGGDAWLVKTDSNGNEQWNRTFDNNKQWNKTFDNNKQWNKTFDGIGWDIAESVQQTSDGGYILVGLTTNFYGDDFLCYLWLVKAESDGNEQWNKTLGDVDLSFGESVQQTSDGGYILAGFTNSSIDVFTDFWLVKTDSYGNEQWNKTFGGSYYSEAYSVQQTSDGGYILAGSTEPYEGLSTYFWLVKTDSNGNEQWNKTFGSNDYSEAYSVQQTSDGGYILAGITGSYQENFFDFWLVKTDPDGNKQWDKTFGGTDRDWAHSVQQTLDGGYILAGSTNSYGAGNSDFWLIKVEREPIESDSDITIPEIPTEEDKGISGFELIFGIAGLLAVIYLFNRKNQR